MPVRLKTRRSWGERRRGRRTASRHRPVSWIHIYLNKIQIGKSSKGQQLADFSYHLQQRATNVPLRLASAEHVQVGPIDEQDTPRSGPRCHDQWTGKCRAFERSSKLRGKRLCEYRSFQNVEKMSQRPNSPLGQPLALRTDLGCIYETSAVRVPLRFPDGAPFAGLDCGGEGLRPRRLFRSREEVTEVGVVLRCGSESKSEDLEERPPRGSEAEAKGRSLERGCNATVRQRGLCVC